MKPIAIGLMAMLAGCVSTFIDSSDEADAEAIGAKGGELKGKSTTVVVPAGALVSTVDLSLFPDSDPSLPAGYVGRPIVLAPAEQTFDKPVTLSLAFTVAELPNPSKADLVKVARLLNGAWEPLADSVVDGGTVTATTSTFGRFAAVAPQ